MRSQLLSDAVGAATAACVLIWSGTRTQDAAAPAPVVKNSAVRSEGAFAFRSPPPGRRSHAQAREGVPIEDDETEGPSPQVRPAPRPVTQEEAKEMHEERWKTELDSFSREGRDEAWATMAEGALRQDLAEVESEFGVRASTLSCRTERCAFELEWSSHDAALEGFAAVLQHPFRTNCWKETLLDDPSGNGPYTSRMVMHCEEWKADGSPLLETHS